MFETSADADFVFCRIVGAADSLFRTKGFDKTSLQDLLEELQMNEVVFYRYFQSMDELLEAVWSESLKIRRKEGKKSLILRDACSLPEDMTGRPCVMSWTSLT